MLPSEALQLFANDLPNSLSEHLTVFCNNIEEEAQQRAAWEDDSGAARKALTAYFVNTLNDTEIPHDKNFSDWEYTRQPDYLSPKYNNTAENFIPEETQTEMSLSDVTVYLSNFVPYGLTLETEDIGKAAERSGLLSGLSNEKTQEFEDVIVNSIKSVLSTIGS